MAIYTLALALARLAKSSTSTQNNTELMYDQHANSHCERWRWERKHKNSEKIRVDNGRQNTMHAWWM